MTEIFVVIYETGYCVDQDHIHDVVCACLTEAEARSLVDTLNECQKENHCDPDAYGYQKLEIV